MINRKEKSEKGLCPRSKTFFPFITPFDSLVKVRFFNLKPLDSWSEKGKIFISSRDPWYPFGGLVPKVGGRNE